MMASVNTDTANASPIAFLNLESENVIDVELDPADLEATDFANLEEALEVSAPLVTSNVDPDTVKGTDSDVTIPVPHAAEIIEASASSEPRAPDAKTIVDSDLAGTKTTIVPGLADAEPERAGASIEDLPATVAVDDPLQFQAPPAEPREASDIEPDALIESAIVPKATEMGALADAASESELEPSPAPQKTTFNTAGTPQPAPSGDTAQDGTPQDRKSPDPLPGSLNTLGSMEPVQGFATGMATEFASPASDTGQPSTLGLSAVTSTTPTISTPSMQAVVAPAQPQANYVAVPADIPSIISRELSSDTQSNRVRIQLDPPELGRVSLEFKFDSQGLQHVLVTADSAEAIRRIRAFHPDLVSVLDEHGLSSQDMTFREQPSDQNPAQSWSNTDADALDSDPDSLAVAASPLQQATPSRTVTNGLDIRV
ncbi:flagellar hook-length control protein FliK [Hyphomonas sp. UBA4494]|uniref:flagellar hook-length control protein FliK n=1 Tax=Hyphomonas sp. UBA4494 TaxID=1946631 RepID=UPI0025C4F4A8|nr:flagellar hook-length control protein FliK [Hyphomonas sp. UBA4494]